MSTRSQPSQRSLLPSPALCFSAATVDQECRLADLPTRAFFLSRSSPPRQPRCDVHAVPSSRLSKSHLHERMLLAIVVPLDRLLWRSGHFDRREEARQAIGDGRVRLNGRSCTRNEAIDPAISCITIDSAPLGPFPPTKVLAMHKPRGVLTTCSTIENEPTVVDVLGESHIPGVAPVGRLDQDTECLLLLTNDGTLTKLLLERGACSKTYIARVVPRRPASPERRDDAWLRSMESGVPLRNGYIAQASRCALLDAKGAAQLGCEVFDSLLDEAFGGDSSSYARGAGNASGWEARGVSPVPLLRMRSDLDSH